MEFLTLMLTEWQQQAWATHLVVVAPQCLLEPVARAAVMSQSWSEFWLASASALAALAMAAAGSRCLCDNLCV